jgi:hypothetical protein
MQVQDPTHENDGSREKDACLKHASDCDLEFLIGYLHPTTYP